MRHLILSLLLIGCTTGCSINLQLPPPDSGQEETIDAGSTTDALVDGEAGIDLNAWVYQEPNLSAVFHNCQRFNNDAGTPDLTVLYNYTGNGSSSIPVYVCSDNLVGCDLEKLLVNTPAYYTYPKPPPDMASVVPNTLVVNCSLQSVEENIWAGVAGSYWQLDYVPSSSHTTPYINACKGDVYLVPIRFYDSLFQVSIDKQANIQFSCF